MLGIKKHLVSLQGVFSTSVYSVKPGGVLLSHGETPHYHRRYSVSLLSSARGQVGPLHYRRRDNSFYPFALFSTSYLVLSSFCVLPMPCLALSLLGHKLNSVKLSSFSLYLLCFAFASHSLFFSVCLFLCAFLLRSVFCPLSSVI